MSFEDDGFLIVDDFFSQSDLDEFNRCLASLPEFDTLGEKYDALAYTPSFLRLATEPKTVMMANLLLNRNPFAPLYCFTNRCLIALPFDESRTYGWHQEVFYSIPESRFIQTWAPLIHDTTVGNGTIEVCVGSHKEGIAKQSWIQPEGRATQIIVDDDVVAKYEQRTLEMKLGQMLFFDSRLFHRSGKNTSTLPRYSLVGMYHAIEPGFRVPKPQFEYRGKTPKEWFDLHAL